MMKIIIPGAAGRMGRRLIANIAADADLTLCGAVEWSGCEFLGCDAGSLAGVQPANVKITDKLTDDMMKDADGVIDFGTGGVMERAETAAKYGKAIVIGTTTLTADEKARLKELANQGARIVFAANFSVGVNLLFYLSKIAADVLKDFDTEIIEAHHNQKKDAPSGTAAVLAEILCREKGLDPRKDILYGREGICGQRTGHEIGMHSVRGGDIVGDHTVLFAASGERVELTHKASGRDTFAKGALHAVKFLASAKPGLYDMQDVLGLKN